MKPSFEKVQHAALVRRWTAVAQGWGAGVVPCAHPCRRHNVAGFAKPRPRAVPGQAVPTVQRLGTRQHGQRAPSPAQRPSMDLGQLSPLGFCRKNMRHVLVACSQDVPWRPKGIVVGEGLGQVARVRRHQVFHIVGFPQGVDAGLVGPLAVVVPCGVQRHVGVRQVVSQIRGGAQHVVQRDRGGVCGGHQGHKLLVRPMQLPGQHPKPSRIQGAVDRSHHGTVVLPAHAHKLGGRRSFRPHVQDVVQIEIMPGRLEGVGVLAGVGRGGMAHQHGGVTAPSDLKARGSCVQALAWRWRCGENPQPVSRAGREQTMAPARSSSGRRFMVQPNQGTVFQDGDGRAVVGRQAILHVLVQIQLAQPPSVRGGL